MPIHEYECPRCKIRFERLELKNNMTAPVCNVCGGPTQKKISAPGAFLITGEGTNVTAYNSGAGTCCGQEGGCDSPKRCCGKG